MRKLIFASFAFVLSSSAVSAEIRVFENNLCPICVDNLLKSEVTLKKRAACTPIACKGEHWDQDGVYHPASPCFDCSTHTFSLSCTQGHTFETATEPERK